MRYRLNGKEITEAEFYRRFSFALRFIEVSIEEAEKAGEPLPMFNTGSGPLVVIKEDEK